MNQFTGSPSLEGNGTFLVNSFWTAGGRPANIGVLNKPGAIVITRIPNCAKSRAIGKVIPTTPPLLAL